MHHIDFTAIITFIMGTLWGWFRRQAVGAVDWLVVDYMSTHMKNIISFIIKKIQELKDKNAS